MKRNKCKTCSKTKDSTEFLKSGSQCKQCNSEYMREYRKKRLSDPEFKRKEQERQKRWWEKNREKGNERQRKYRKNNESYKLSNALRARVKYALEGCVKSNQTFDLLGCSPNEWKEHLESKFDQKMNWDNYGIYWEVDHIIPVSHFDLTKESEQKKAFNFKNTQPLKCVDNRRKGNRWIG